MKRALILFAVMAAPLHAEEAESDLLERGAQMFLEGLLREMEPALDELQDLSEKMSPALRGFMLQMGPALEDLKEKVDDWTAYHPPEILDNGDIIIRRKVSEPVPDKDDIEI